MQKTFLSVLLRQFYRGLHLLPALLLGFQLQAQHSLMTDSEFLRQRSELEKRYKDFYAHLKRAEMAQQKRLSGIPLVKKEREQSLKRQEQLRKQFVKNRQAAPSKEAQRLQWEAEQRRLAKIQEKRRSLYVMRRDEIRRLLQTSKRIPPEVELGLDLN